MRIQFDMTEKEIKRLEPYLPGGLKSRHVFGHKAYIEWITRQEGRDRRNKKEQLKQRAADIQEVLDAGLIDFEMRNCKS